MASLDRLHDELGVKVDHSILHAALILCR